MLTPDPPCVQWLATVPPSRSMAEEDGGHMIANHPELAAELEPLAETIAAPAGSLVIWHRLCVARHLAALYTLPHPKALWVELTVPPLFGLRSPRIDSLN